MRILDRGTHIVNPNREFQIKVLNKRDNIPEIARFIDETLKSFGMADGNIYDMNIAVEEACTNIIQYGYLPDEEGAIEVLCKLLEDHKVAVLIKDNGKPFDQTQSVQPDTTSSLEDRKPGGLGRFFMSELVDEIYYECKEGYEIITMIKHLD